MPDMGVACAIGFEVPEYDGCRAWSGGVVRVLVPLRRGLPKPYFAHVVLLIASVFSRKLDSATSELHRFRLGFLEQDSRFDKLRPPVDRGEGPSSLGPLGWKVRGHQSFREIGPLNTKT